MSTYHVKFSSDGDATRAYWATRQSITAAGGTHHVAPSMGHGDAFVVANLPEGVDPEIVFNGVEHKGIAEFVPADTTVDRGLVAGEITTDEAAALFTEDEDFDDWDEPYYDDDDEDDEGWDDLDDFLYLSDEEDEDDQPEEDSGNGTGVGSSEESPVEGIESAEAASLGSDEGVPF
jgi:hypothetical protein